MIELPVFIDLKRKRGPAKRIYLNLGIYRNLHFQLLNKAKKEFKVMLYPAIKKLPKYERVALSYTLYAKTRRLCDIANICTVVDKFFSDALVEYGKLPDDNYKFLPAVQFSWGGIDPTNPRVEVEIIEVEL